jgi:aminotransferase in exopolysaccharide biosynthesis
MPEASFIPLSVPNLSGNEKAYVNTAVETEWVSTGGPYVKDFEKAVASYVHSPMAVSCQNGTSGIHLALLLAHVGCDDAVIVPTLTFIAAVNPVMYVGASPIFMDCDDTLCLDPDKLEAYCVTQCRMDGNTLRDNRTGKHIKAIIVVHVFGEMANMEKILTIAAHYHFHVIEDATEAIGTYYTAGPYTGSFAGTLGFMGIFSFNGNKIITTGGGGMIVSKDKPLLQRAMHLSTQAKSDELHYLHDEVGYNYRMTNLQAALGLAQMEQLERFIEAKNSNYEFYKEHIKDIAGVHLLPFRTDVRSNHWFYSLFIDDHFPLTRNEVIAEFSACNIQTRPVWGLIHEQVPYKSCYAYDIERAKFYQEHIVNIPCSTNITRDEMVRVVSCLQRMSK